MVASDGSLDFKFLGLKKKKKKVVLFFVLFSCLLFFFAFVNGSQMEQVLLPGTGRFCVGGMCNIYIFFKKKFLPLILFAFCYLVSPLPRWTKCFQVLEDC